MVHRPQPVGRLRPRSPEGGDSIIPECLEWGPKAIVAGFSKSTKGTTKYSMQTLSKPQPVERMRSISAGFTVQCACTLIREQIPKFTIVCNLMPIC